MLKSNIYIGLLSAGLLLTTGCDKQLDLKPAQSVVVSDAIKNTDDLQAMLNGAYDALSSPNALGCRLQMMSELLGDNEEVNFVGTFPDPREFYNKRILVSSQDVAAMWLACYRVINIANTILENINVADANVKSRIEGEALFLRGIMHFELVRLYGKNYEQDLPNNEPEMGVPIMLKSNSEEKVKRNTVAEVYQAVIKDLTDAETKLPARNGIYANKWAAAGYLSRVYLQQNRYELARDAADRVIKSGQYALTPDFADAFNKAANTTEDIFAIQSSVQDNVNVIFTFFAPQAIGGRGDIPILPKHLSQYENNDARLAFFYEESGDTWTGKWQEPNAGNVNIIRLAEMLLTRAECNFRLGQTTGATPLADVNTVRSRAKLTPLTTVTLENILKERKLELFCEGNRVHEVKRLKQSIIGSKPDGSPLTLNYNANALVAPIPRRELNVNPNLKQNAGY